MIISLLLLSASGISAQGAVVAKPKPVPVIEIDGFEEVGNETAPTNRPRTRYGYQRNNPRSTFEIRLASKPGGRPPLVDAAGKAVKRNLVFGVKNPQIGAMRVYATRLKIGPFFTAWAKVPKGLGTGYVQIIGAKVTAAEARKIVEGLRWVAPNADIESTR